MPPRLTWAGLQLPAPVRFWSHGRAQTPGTGAAARQMGAPSVRRSRVVALLALLVIDITTPAQSQGGFAQRVIVVAIDGGSGSLIAASEAPTLQRFLAEGAGTVNGRANLPSVTVPNWASSITGNGPSELSIATNSWERATATAPPVGFEAAPGGLPAVTDPWMPNVLESAKAAGADVKLFHDWAPLDRVLSSTFVASDSVSTTFCSDTSVRLLYRTSLDCWSGTDQDAVDGAIAAIAAGEAGKQLVWLHQAYVDEVGHSHGWMSPEQIDATAVLDNRVADVVAAIEEVDPSWSETLLIVTSHHGGYGTGHGQQGTEFERAAIELLSIPWIAFGAGVAGGTSLDEEKRYVNNMDTAPTVLWALGLEPLANCRGQTVVEAFTAGRTGTGESGLLGVVVALLAGGAIGWVARVKLGQKPAADADVSEKEMLVGE